MLLSTFTKTSSIVFRVLLVHLVANKLEVGNLGSVLDQPPHVLSIGLVDVIVDRFQVQAVHLEGRGSPETRELTAQLGGGVEGRQQNRTAGKIHNATARLQSESLAMNP